MRIWLEWLAVTVGLLLLTPPTAAQQASAEVKLPRLGSHTFVVNDLVDDPFIKTFVRNSVGIGSVSDFDVPVAVIEGDTIVGFKGDLLFALLEFEYQHAVKDWIAARGSFRLAGRLGTGVQSLLASGVTAATEFELGWLIKLLRGDRAMLSGSLNINNGDVTAINVLRFVEDIIDDQPASLIRTTPSLRGGGGLRFAYGLSPLFGFTVFGDLGYGESVDSRAASDWYYEVGGGVSLNLNGSTSVPLGFSLGYKAQSLPVSSDIDNDIAEVLFRIAYTGRDDFSISVDINYGDLPVTGLREDGRLGTMRLNMRYYF
jgi:hypothetical protein